MYVSVDRSTFDKLIDEPYGVLATYLAYLFMCQEEYQGPVSQYALYTKTRISPPTVRKAWRRLKELDLVGSGGGDKNVR